jgi:hypothetical protein
VLCRYTCGAGRHGTGTCSKYISTKPQLFASSSDRTSASASFKHAMAPQTVYIRQMYSQSTPPLALTHPSQGRQVNSSIRGQGCIPAAEPTADIVALSNVAIGSSTTPSISCCPDCSPCRMACLLAGQCRAPGLPASGTQTWGGELGLGASLQLLHGALRCHHHVEGRWSCGGVCEVQEQE